MRRDGSVRRGVARRHRRRGTARDATSPNSRCSGFHIAWLAARFARMERFLCCGTRREVDWQSRGFSSTEVRERLFLRKYLPSDARVRRMSMVAWDVGVWFLATLALIGARFDFSSAISPGRRPGLRQQCGRTPGGLRVLLRPLPRALQGGQLLRGLPARHRGDGRLCCHGLLAVLHRVPTERRPLRPADRPPPHGQPSLALPRLLLRPRPRRFRGEGPVLVYGAGFIGTRMAQLIRATADAPYRVVGFLDDDAASATSTSPGRAWSGPGWTSNWWRRPAPRP